MRIITGEYGGRKLNTPSGQVVRPTSDKVRGAMFNILHNKLDWQDYKVLDVFCGSGAIGIEALSRGAEHATFIDIDTDLVKSNIEKLKIENANMVRIDIDRLGEAKEKYNLIFIDPPYNQGLGEKALEKLQENLWLADDALVVLEDSVRAKIDLPNSFAIKDEREYGKSKISFIENA